MVNFFKLYSYLICRVNFAADTIQHDRFVYERRLANKQQFENNNSNCNCNCINHPNENTNRGMFGWLRRCFDDLIWMLEYNQLSMFHLLLFLASVTTLTLMKIVSMSYILRPRDRDPSTGLYQDGLLRFFESIYLIEIWSKTDESGMLHQLVSIVCLPLILRRLECLRTKMRNAKINKYKYVKLDAIQMNVAHIDHFELGSLWDLLPLWKACYNHTCRRQFALGGPEGKRIKRTADRLIGSDRIDWLYSNNLIDFDDCYRGDLIHYERNKLTEYSREEHRRAIYDGTKSIWSRMLALCRAEPQKPKRLFFARPFHRMHTGDLLPLVALYTAAVIGYLFIIWLGITTYYYPIARDYGADPNNILLTFGGAFLRSLRDPKNLAGLVFVSLHVIYTAINLADVAFLVHNAVVELSRANLIIQMFEIEINFQQSHIKAFTRYLEENKLTIDGLTKFSVPASDDKNAGDHPEEDEEDDGEDDEMVEEEQEFDGPTNRLGDRDLSLSREKCYDTLYIYATKPQEPGEHKGTQDGLFRSRPIDQLVKHFKISTVDQRQQMEFTENIRYLLNLVRVLQEEHTDLKAHFTWNLNLSVLAGTVGLSIASSMYYNADSFHRFLSTSLGVFVMILPVIVSLFMGATTEISFRRITQRIRPLMVNELKLVDQNTVKRLQSVYLHLSSIENRSFMILGNLPLTFGSLTSIIGWIASCNLLFQRLIP